MRPIRAGRLRKRVVVEVATDGIGDDGSPTVTWKTFKERSASVEPVETSGREYLQGASIEADITHTVGMRWFSGLTPKHRINYGGRILEIQSVTNVEERGRMLIVFCKEQIGRP